MEEKVEVEDYDQLAKELERASPLEVIDKALEKFGNDIAIAFRWSFSLFTSFDQIHFIYVPVYVYSCIVWLLYPVEFESVAGWAKV